ncbi:MAG: hypothetical protein F6J98_03385 [Moorea sp. SIO4G2]|nr:hypothetical protein [Moorena sp. SIO4A3]NEO59497.1 hypothetical protein [Moorena sp. SIO4G2]
MQPLPTRALHQDRDKNQFQYFKSQILSLFPVPCSLLPAPCSLFPILRIPSTEC